MNPESPATIFLASEDGERCTPYYADKYGTAVKYIRADLVERLKGYAAHDDECGVNSVTNRPRDCTCGLAELLKEIE